jgi:phosphate acetyltransferase
MQSLYIAGAGSGSGKSVVVLGFMEMLSAVRRQVGFFRPIVRRGVDDDSLTALIRSRYELPFAPEMLYGCTAETANQLVAGGHYDELLKLILNKFKMLEEKCDLVVCAGTDFDGAVPSLEFDFNADLANNLGCMIVAVVKGFRRSPEETLNAVQMAHESLLDRGGDLLATVVNGVSADDLALMRSRARSVLPDSELVYVLPEQTALSMPTVGEVRKALKAECLCGEGDALTQVVTNYKIAAMEIPDFLNYIEDGCLIITPGDRSDIILASLLADVHRRSGRAFGRLGLRAASAFAAAAHHRGDQAGDVCPGGGTPGSRADEYSIRGESQRRRTAIRRTAERNHTVYILEVNPRASRTSPFVSKATNRPLAKIAAKIMAGVSLREQGITEEIWPTTLR